MLYQLSYSRSDLRGRYSPEKVASSDNAAARARHWMVTVYCWVALASLPRGLDTSTA
jgi:hypothetical protein